jgi:hypothetical protein
MAMEAAWAGEAKTSPAIESAPRRIQPDFSIFFRTAAGAGDIS